MRQWKAKYEKKGMRMLFDGRKGKRNWRKVEAKQVDQVVSLYRDRYQDFNVLHFHEKLIQEHGIHFSYTWVRNALQGAGLVKKTRSRPRHRKRRARKRCLG